MLDAMPPGIFGSGVAQIENPMRREGPMITVKWIAAKGFGYDWAIYISAHENIIHFLGFKTAHWTAEDDVVHKHGAKLHYAPTILDLVPCDEAVLKAYRH